MSPDSNTVTTNEIMARLFPPNGQSVPIDMARNWTSIERSVARLVSTMNGEPFIKILTASQLAVRNKRIYQILDEDPAARLQSVADAAGVTTGVVKHVKAKWRLLAATRDDQIVEKVPFQDAKPEQIESPPKPAQELKPDSTEPVRTGSEGTVRKSLIVRESEEVKPPGKRASDLTPSEAGKIDGPKIPHSEDEWILQQLTAGNPTKEILAELNAKGHDCNYGDLAYRIKTIRHSREMSAKGKKPASAPTRHELAALKKATTPQPVESGSEKSPESKVEPKSISRADLDTRIWKEWKSGKSPKEISDALCDEGYYYGEQRVRRMLLQQGADL